MYELFLGNIFFLKGLILTKLCTHVEE